MTLEQAKRMVQSVPLPEDDILFEILSRLPVESLLRCKSVCKSWLSLISNPLFIKSHLKLSSTKIAHHRLIFFNDSPEKKLKSCPLNDVLFEKSVVNSMDLVCPSDLPLQSIYEYPFRIVGSCNGLVCIVFYHLKGVILFIWNPSIKISTRLYSTFDVPPGRKGYVVYGFAYDNATDDYKIVAVHQNKVKIYSLKTGNWKEIGDFPHGYPMNYKSGVFSNGYLHWMATPTPTGDNEPTYQCTIVSLSLSNETYGEVSQPVYEEGAKVLTLGDLGEWLCVLCDYRFTCANVWVMKIYGVQDSWTKLVSISYPANNCIFRRPIFISSDGTILLQSTWMLVVCDTDTKDGSSSRIENWNGLTAAYTFVESLVSPYPSIST